MLTDKITFLLTNKKIRNLLIIVIIAFLFVGVLTYLDLYEGMNGGTIVTPLQQTSDKTLLEKMDKTTENTNIKVNNMNMKLDNMKQDNMKLDNMKLDNMKPDNMKLENMKQDNMNDLVIDKEQI